MCLMTLVSLVRLIVRNSIERYQNGKTFTNVVKIYIIRPKPGPVPKNATPRRSGWESNPRHLPSR